MGKTRLMKTLHRWLSLIVGLQLLIWLGTGLYINLMDHDKASGNALRQTADHQGNGVDFALMPVSVLDIDEPVSIKLIWILGRPYYQLVYVAPAHFYQQHESRLIDAINGSAYQLDADTASKVALLSYKGTPVETAVQWLSPPIDELPRQENPVWRVSVNDERNTYIYLDGQTGAVLTHMNDDSRLKKLMLKLHFMDYAGTGGFNHWLIIAFALAALFLVATGVIWVVELIQTRRLYSPPFTSISN